MRNLVIVPIIFFQTDMIIINSFMTDFSIM